MLFCFDLSVFRVWVLVLIIGENARRRLLVSAPVGCAAGVRSCLGLFAFLPIICGLHVAVFGVSFYYMEKIQAGRRLVFGFC